MKIKVFSCGFCHNYDGTRRGLRNHLKDHVRNQFANSSTKGVADANKNKTPQKWWITKECE